jgi:hypothetical protein
MKRQSVLRIMISCLNTDDIAIFAGEGICHESHEYNRSGSFYIPDKDYAASFALGIANGTSKRVFIFCEDYYFIRNLSEAAQIAVSKCKNLTYIILRSNMYQEDGFYPTIVSEIGSLKSMMFHMGFLVHHYTSYFKNSNNPSKDIKQIWANITGPMIVFVDIDKGANKKAGDSDIDYSIYTKEFIDFVRG